MAKYGNQSLVFADNSISGDKIIAGTLDGAKLTTGSITQDQVASGFVVGSKFAASEVYKSTTSTIPDVSTPAQITEGAEAMNMVYSPLAIGNLLVVSWQAQIAPSQASVIQAALFKDSIVDAIGHSRVVKTALNYATILTGETEITVDALGDITFSTRFGHASAGTVYLNGTSSGSFGAPGSKTFIKVQEIRA